jgi:putative transposase
VTPHQRHAGLADKVLAKRKRVYQDAKGRNPNRWSGEIRNWDLPEEVHLNPERNTAKVESA